MATRWSEKMAPRGVWAIRLFGWVGALVMFIAPVIKGMSFEWVAFFMVSGVTLAVMLSYYALLLRERIDKLMGDVQEGEDFAQKIEDRIRVGDGPWTANDLATLWAGAGAPHFDWNLRFRWIKHAVLNGHVPGERLNENGQPVAETLIPLKELAAFFRRRDWKQLVTAPEGLYARKL